MSVHRREYSVLILAPRGETRKVIENVFGVGVENMRAVFVNEYSGLVVTVVGVAGDMRALVHQQHFFVRVARQTLGQNAAGETGSNNEIIEHGFLIMTNNNHKKITEPEALGARANREAVGVG